MRGKVPVGFLVLERHRITPACAGKSAVHRVDFGVEQDHPRVCGEKFRYSRKKLPERGSPPRVRGKELRSGLLLAFRGITPACAGKSPARGGRRFRPEDHPRVCGEKAVLLRFRLKLRGSPPRVRGKVGYSVGGKGARRITPACAGKRVYHLVVGHLFLDHPRVCGEKPFQPYFSSPVRGSPPRVRGKERIT